MYSLYSKLVLAIFLSLWAVAGHAQFSIEVSTDPGPISAADGDTVSACPGKPVRFMVRPDTLFTQEDDTITSKEFLYNWDFGDGERLYEMGADTVEHEFASGQGYYVMLDVIYQDTVAHAVIPVQIALPPSSFTTEVSPDAPVCSGDPVQLSGSADSASWQYEPPRRIEEPFPAIFTDAVPYTPTVNFVFRSFGAGDTLQNLDSLQSICVEMEHSNAQDVQIDLICPNDTLTLKAPSESAAYMGEPIDQAGVSVEGVPYTYCWSSGPGYGTMNEEAGKHTHSYTDEFGNAYDDVPYLPADSAYTPHEPLENLVGCPLNGEWRIEARDNQLDNNGFVFSWEINFKDSFFLPKWQYSNTYDNANGLWSGDKVGASQNGGATAKPEEYGQSPYRFTVETVEWGECRFSAETSAEVTQPTFDANPQQGEADPDIEVSFSATTEWAVDWYWDFGNEGTGTGEGVSNIYDQKGEYPVLLTARSETGCEDISDTVMVTITVPESKLEMPDVFTPNGDGVNDVFLPKEIKALEEAEGKIYSRWGRVVCKWESPEDIEEGWDGTIGNNDGPQASPGVYYYVIIGKGRDNVEWKEKGAVHLFRTN